uniref:Homeobox domain-containing protein n=1 Tax=Panagrolaimus davidi TaxID=227884 RepID=A0A914QF83_9BILA
MDSSSLNSMSILQQFSQLLFLQSLASGKSLNSMNPAMFGFPQTQISQPNFPQQSTQVKPLLPPSSPTLSDPSKHLQTISDLLSSPSLLKSQLSPSFPSSSSETSPFKLDYENIQPTRQYKVHVNRESAKPLQEWMNQNITNPYPTQLDVQKLSSQTGFTFKQIRNWFTNNRRRYEEKCGSQALPWIKKDSPISKKICKSEFSTENSIHSLLL